jgi:hypothetical protein
MASRANNARRVSYHICQFTPERKVGRVTIVCKGIHRKPIGAKERPPQFDP